MSKVEVRFEDLRVDADVHVGGRAMPTVLNSVRNFVEVCMQPGYTDAAIPGLRRCKYCLECPESAGPSCVASPNGDALLAYSGERRSCSCASTVPLPMKVGTVSSRCLATY